MANSFMFNGISSEDFGIRVERMPSLSRSARKYTSVSVPGQNGNSYELEDAYNEKIVPYEVFAGEKNTNGVATFTGIVEWVNSADSYAMLKDTYDPTHYRKAIFADTIDIESTWHTLGRMILNFRCRPERYIVEDEITVSSGATINNPTNHVAKPLIKLTGAGAQNLFGLLSQRAVSYGEPYLTQLSRSPAQKMYLGVNWQPVDGKVPCLDSAVTLSLFDDTVGKVPFTSTTYGYGIGFPVWVEPNSAYSVSFNISKTNASPYDTAYIAVHFYDRGRRYLRSVSQPIDFGDVMYTFTAPYGAEYAVITIAGDAGSYTLTGMMLNHGKEAKAFRQYSAAEVRLKIKDTIMVISESFENAVVDCEEESLTLEGARCDYAAKIIDTYNELSVDYLKLDVGDNKVIYSAESCVMDRRLWEL